MVHPARITRMKFEKSSSSHARVMELVEGEERVRAVVANMTTSSHS
jgi:hypothetical protein